MKEVEIKSEINDDNIYYNNRSFNLFINNLSELLIKLFHDLRYILYFFVVLFCIFTPSFNILTENIDFDLSPFIKYITDCNNSINYVRYKIHNKNPYISICIPAYNVEKFIEKNLLSIINQSFQDFEIIIVNDASEDGTKNIINKFQESDKRIKLLSHSKKLGVYHSRIETIFNSKSEYILLMDPDDMYLNENLFQKLYDYNSNKNLDIIEFLVLQQIEGNDKIFFPKIQFGNHYHNFKKDIIFQPELSNLLYHYPGRNEYSRTICRNIWNKMIRNYIFIEVSKYIGSDYYNKYVIAGDDMILNIVIYQFAKNYSNIKLPGYLYIQRNISMSKGGNDELKQIRANNFIWYFQLFYKYLQDYKKDINILYYEMKNLDSKLLIIKQNNISESKSILFSLIEQIIKENNISNEFHTYLDNLSRHYKN